MSTKSYHINLVFIKGNNCDSLVVGASLTLRLCCHSLRYVVCLGFCFNIAVSTSVWVPAFSLIPTWLYQFWHCYLYHYKIVFDFRFWCFCFRFLFWFSVAQHFCFCSWFWCPFSFWFLFLVSWILQSLFFVSVSVFCLGFLYPVLLLRFRFGLSISVFTINLVVDAVLTLLLYYYNLFSFFLRSNK